MEDYKCALGVETCSAKYRFGRCSRQTTIGELSRCFRLFDRLPETVWRLRAELLSRHARCYACNTQWDWCTAKAERAFRPGICLGACSNLPHRLNKLDPHDSHPTQCPLINYQAYH